MGFCKILAQLDVFFTIFSSDGIHGMVREEKKNSICAIGHKTHVLI